MRVLNYLNDFANAKNDLFYFISQILSLKFAVLKTINYHQPFRQRWLQMMTRDLWVRNLFKNLAMILQKDIVCHTNLQITNQWNSYCAPVDASQLAGIIDFQALSFFSWQLISICQYRKRFHGTWKLTFGEIAVLSSRMVLLCVSFVLPSKKKTEFKWPWDR